MLDPKHIQTANYIAGVVSLFVPGLGQMFQGRGLLGIGIFFLAVTLWMVALGWIVHLMAAVDAARYAPGKWEWVDDPRSDEELDASLMRKMWFQIAAACAVGSMVVALAISAFVAKK